MFVLLILNVLSVKVLTHMRLYTCGIKLRKLVSNPVYESLWYTEVTNSPWFCIKTSKNGSTPGFKLPSLVN